MHRIRHPLGIRHCFSCTALYQSCARWMYEEVGVSLLFAWHQWYSCTMKYSFNKGLHIKSNCVCQMGGEVYDWSLCLQRGLGAASECKPSCFGPWSGCWWPLMSPSFWVLWNCLVSVAVRAQLLCSSQFSQRVMVMVSWSLEDWDWLGSWKISRW